MSSTKAQDWARQRNYILFTLRSIKGMLRHILKKLAPVVLLDDQIDSLKILYNRVEDTIEVMELPSNYKTFTEVLKCK